MADDVTRTEIADHLAAVFANGAVSRSDLLIAAAGRPPRGPRGPGRAARPPLHRAAAGLGGPAAVPVGI
ncbi:hypothetical protein [Streptomyces somaliensis]|uniref:hypothetical protein n=1 Tax=Streptomyces somaliensis TaxID=78355 RepID=UPI0034E96CB1|nr:hypothetical protein [Streptomyces somaliensis]